MKKQTPYKPPKKILENYAKVLVHFGLNKGKGIKKSDVVVVSGNEASKPLFAEVLHEIWKSGGHVIQKYAPTNEKYFSFDRTFYECADEHQLDHFPRRYMKGLADEADHSIFIIAETDKMPLKKIDPKKIMQKTKSHKPYKDWRNKKESEGKFSWTLCLYGTPDMAKEAGLSQKAYWDQIIKACYLEHKDPVQKWKDVQKQMDGIIKKMNKLNPEKFHIEGEDADLWITLGEKRKWIGGRGCNIPSFEIFTSPDWRGTQGWIRFNQLLYRYGNFVEGVELEFVDGKVVRSSAKKNYKVLKSMIETEGADKVGEFSLTDKRFSHITKFMAETLYDENAGGEYGNTHIALGSSFHDCFKGNQAKMKKNDWKKLGFNDSAIHTDIVSTTDRTVTAHFKNGKKKVIYKNGRFVL